MLRFLLIGNDSTVFEHLSQQPEVPPFEFELAAGGVDAIRRLRRRRFDLVLTAPQTSVDEDLALLAEVRAVRPGIKAILLAPSATREEVIEALRADVFACFTSPFDWSEVAALAKAAVEDHDWRKGIEVLSATEDWIALRVQCRIMTAERVVQFMREMAADQPGETRERLIFAFREVLLNAMEHGAGFDPEQVVEVSAVRTQRTIVYHFRDPGPGFRRDALPHATRSSARDDIEAAFEFREDAGLRPGGFGMLLVSKLVDEVIYNETGNQVILVKHTR